MFKMIKSEKINHIRSKIPAKTPIIVEGKRDKEVLEKIGFKNIIPISGKTNTKMLELLKEKKYGKVAILTDFDKEGKERCKELTRLFQKHGIKIDSFVRRTFGRTFRIKEIEDLKSFTKLIEGDYYNGHTLHEKIFNRNKFLSRQKKKNKS